MALRGVVKAELDAMADKQVITPVTEPTKWVSSMVVAQKKNYGKVCICLDSQHLNKVVISEYISKTHSHSTQGITTDAPSTTEV